MISPSASSTAVAPSSDADLIEPPVFPDVAVPNLQSTEHGTPRRSRWSFSTSTTPHPRFTYSSNPVNMPSATASLSRRSRRSNPLIARPARRSLCCRRARSCEWRLRLVPAPPISDTVLHAEEPIATTKLILYARQMSLIVELSLLAATYAVHGWVALVIILAILASSLWVFAPCSEVSRGYQGRRRTAVAEEQEIRSLGDKSPEAAAKPSGVREYCAKRFVDLHRPRS